MGLRSNIFAFGLIACLVALAAHAQEDPDEGPLALATGFVPDPIVFSGTTAPSRPLTSFARGCDGFVGGEPARRIRLTTPFTFLRVFVDSPGDVSLAMRLPDGRFECGSALLMGRPYVEGAYAPGEYQLWVGSRQRERVLPFRVSITEMRSVTPLEGGSEAPVVSGAQAGLSIHLWTAAQVCGTSRRDDVSRFRPRCLRRGFLPDPRSDEGRAGGSVDASVLGRGCAGFVDTEPNHALALRSEFDYFRIRVESEAPTTLIVRLPGERESYRCASPTRGDPVVDGDRESLQAPATWPQGIYLIWVGSQAAGTRPQYRIRYTEVPAA